MELSWKRLEDVPAESEGSAYAEFWLHAPGAGDRQRALAGVVAGIGPVLEELLRTPPQKPTPKQRDDSPASAP